MDQPKIGWEKQVWFKRPRSQLQRNIDGNKEAKQGRTYQSKIRLNRNPNKSTDRDQVANEVDVNIKITKEELQQLE